MKVVKKLAVMISLTALMPLAAFAKSDEETYIETSPRGPGIPVPITVVSPDIAPGHAGAKVSLKFTVDATGTPTHFKVVSSTNPAVTGAVVDAVKKWRFKPAERNGVAVATKVSLPVHVAPPVRYAMN